MCACMHKHSFPPAMLVVSNSILGLQQISTVSRLAKFALCCSFQLILLFFFFKWSSDFMLLLYNLLMNLLAPCICVLRMVSYPFFNVIFVHVTQWSCLLILSASLLVILHTHEITQGTQFIMCLCVSPIARL